jgi:hypothetical protein
VEGRVENCAIKLSTSEWKVVELRLKPREHHWKGTLVMNCGAKTIECIRLKIDRDRSVA